MLAMKMTKSGGGVKRPLHSGQAVAGEDEYCTEKRKSLDSLDVPVHENGKEHSTREKKLKGLVGNVGGDTFCSSYDSLEFTESSRELPNADVTVREAAVIGEGSQSMIRLSCGSISVMGRRRVMEDALTVAPGILAREYEFFAAYDGHDAAMVSHACRDLLHLLLEKELEGNWRDLSGDKSSTSDGKNGIDWTKVMEACFSKMDEELQMYHNHNRERVEHEVGEAAENWVGSTAVVVLVGTEELVVANRGDSRAVLFRGGVTMPLSNDHKPDRPDETKRVKAAGGRVINWLGCRVQGVLATSRSIGDRYLKPFVISEPEVTVNKRTDLDDFLIIATDGLWDVVSNDVACHVVNRRLNGQISKNFSRESCSAAAAILAELAIAKCQGKQGQHKCYSG